MKNVCRLIVCALIILFVAYIILMAIFEGPIRVDITDHVRLSVEDQSIELPWYMDIGTTYQGKLNGSDTAGQNYTMFIYELPEIFESAEIKCVLCWETKKVIAFIGDSRAMHVIDEMFPTIKWY